MKKFHPQQPDPYIQKAGDQEIAKFGHLNALVDEINAGGGSSTGYKKYVATLSQSTTSQTSGFLIVGKHYVIDQLLGNDDFLNVGYVTPGTIFTATGTTPFSWTDSTLVTDTDLSAPVVIILENTLGITPVWSYGGIGVYYATSSGAFPATKTVLFSTGGDSTAACTFVASRQSSSVIQVVATEDIQRIDGLITPITPGNIEIRIYP